MKFKNAVKCICLFAVITLIIASCKKDRHTGWDTEILAPIANTSLSLQNIVKDSSIKVNGDQSLTLAYKSTLYQFNLADKLIRIPDTSIGQKYTLNNLILPSQN